MLYTGSIEFWGERVLDFATADTSSQAGWEAGLRLAFGRNDRGTVLQSAEHFGPLRVQRPFYPEGPVCHVYLLHPPGGMVAGDNLSIALDLEEGTHSLITTPAAGKLYRVAARARPQYQGVSAHVCKGAALEWLPQETIGFNGAVGELRNRFELESGATLIGWDILCLGRRASGETFDSGRLKQRIEIYRDGQPVFLDRMVIEGGSQMQAAPWGLNGQPVVGTLFAALGDCCTPDPDALRAHLPDGLEWGITRRGEMLLARYLGQSSEACRRGFEKLWEVLRPALLQRPAIRPRIWNT